MPLTLRRSLLPCFASMTTRPLSVGFATLQKQLAPVSKLSSAVGSSAAGLGRPEWGGLTPSTLTALGEMGVRKPTPTQAAYIPRILAGESLLLGAATGTGKTIAYLAPLLQRLKEAEAAGLATRRQRPRLLILAPTRELALQILGVVKAFSHVLKLRSVAVVGGAKQSSQRDALDSPVDVLVGTPGRLALLHSQGHVHLSDVRAVVIDEADTLLLGGGGGSGSASADADGRPPHSGGRFGSGQRGRGYGAPGYRGRDGRDGGLQRLRAGEGAGVGGFMSEVQELLGRLRARTVAAARAASAAAGDEDGAAASVALMEGDGDDPGAWATSHGQGQGQGRIQYILAGATMPAALAKKLAGLIPELKTSASGAARGSGSAAAAAGSSAAARPAPPALPPSAALHVVPARIAQEFRRVGGGAGAKHAALAEVLGELLGSPDEGGGGGGAAGAGASGAAGDSDSGSGSDSEIEVAAARASKSSSSASPSSAAAAGGPGRAARARARLARRGGRVIVFCSSVASARSTAFFAAEQGYSAASLHGEIPPARRAEEFALFASGKVPLLICTDAAARGLDFPSAQAVVMFDFPRTAADYVHRAGRVGRAGRAGRCIALCGPRDAYLSRGIEAAVGAGKPLAPDMPTRDPRAGADDEDEGDGKASAAAGAGAGAAAATASDGPAGASRSRFAGGAGRDWGRDRDAEFRSHSHRSGSTGPRPSSPPPGGRGRRPGAASSAPVRKSAGFKSDSRRRR